MATKKYNPYNSARKIVDLKGAYDSAKWQNGNYKQYQDEAAQYYSDLVANGYAEAAEQLAQRGYNDALDYLNNSGWKTDEEVEFDEWYDNLGKVSTGDKRTASEQQTDYIDKLMGVGTGETSPQTSDAVSKLMDQWFADNQTYIDRSGELHDAGMSGLDSLLNYDYTQQSFYQPIMDSYNLFGQNAANGALASGASGNAGNIDSYAAANAARQQLAFTNAGHQAALAAAQQNQGNWQTLYNQMSGNVNNAGALNSQNLATIAGMYSTDSAERQAAVDAVEAMYGKDSEERKNALTEAAGIINQQAISDAQKYVADKNYDSTVYQWDIEKYLGDIGYNSDTARIAADQAIAQTEANANIEKQRLANEGNLAVAQYEADSKKTEAEAEEKTESAAAEAKAAREAGVQELYSVLSELVNAMRGGQYADIKSVDDIRREIKNWSGYTTAYDPIIQSYLAGFERKFGTTS